MNSNSVPTYVDGLIPPLEFEQLTEYFLNTSWKFGWGSNTIGESFVHWNRHFAGGGKSTLESCEEELQSNVTAQPIAAVWKQIKADLLPGQTLIRCYANAHTFGLDGTIHRDNPVDVDATTTIVYCHPIWPVPWGGELMFYTNDVSAVQSAILPKPGRIAIFQGSVPHSAKSPARVCRGLRISLVFKSLRNHASV